MRALLLILFLLLLVLFLISIFILLILPPLPRTTEVVAGPGTNATVFRFSQGPIGELRTSPKVYRSGSNISIFKAATPLQRVVGLSSFFKGTGCVKGHAHLAVGGVIPSQRSR